MKTYTLQPFGDFSKLSYFFCGLEDFNDIPSKADMAKYIVLANEAHERPYSIKQLCRIVQQGFGGITAILWENVEEESYNCSETDFYFTTNDIILAINDYITNLGD